ncbi:Polycystin-2 [Durusdinium trenchii]|uniref:Polycystin-2 n=1 Tax=Durusdinium trenchii TaxID=1381693 RepID=A0ABP0LFT3_9DINO
MTSGVGAWCHWLCSPRVTKPSVTFKEAGERHEPEVEPEEQSEEELTLKQKLLQRLKRMNTGDLLRQIRRNISSFSVLPDSEGDLSWDGDDMATEPEISFAVQELQAYFSDWQDAQTDNFWQRKSRKVVISVVVCAQEDGTLHALRGMNTEVSLPSGSLCAERAGIARAASEFFHAKSIKAIAVLDPSGEIAPLWPCELRRSVTTELHVAPDDFRNVVCGLASLDLKELFPSWLSWMNPWLEPTAPDLCGAVSQSGHFQSTASAISSGFESVEDLKAEVILVRRALLTSLTMWFQCLWMMGSLTCKKM